MLEQKNNRNEEMLTDRKKVYRDPQAEVTIFTECDVVAASETDPLPWYRSSGADW